MIPENEADDGRRSFCGAKTKPLWENALKPLWENAFQTA
jgi:hypothetical protein